jgi:hypothetical protein
MRLADLLVQGGKIQVVLPDDPEASWDVEVAANDYVWHTYRDLMWQCADYLAGLPEVTDVPYDGGEVIPVCGPVSPSTLELLVVRWWDDALSRAKEEP